jgi:Uncharacterised protein conserved in bacteria (DUF2336)
MSDTRPSGGEVDGAAELLASARARVAVAAADLALPADGRLTEWQRTTVWRLLADLLRRIEDQLRAALAEAFEEPAIRAALGSAHLPIAEPILGGGSALLDPNLTAALLRRAEEHRLRGAAGPALLGDLAGDDDEAVAAEAMGLLILESGRIDRFGDPAFGRFDLPAEIQHRLAWQVAAALRRYLVRVHGVAPARADAALAAAVAGLLARYDEGAGADPAAYRLARRLDELGRLDAKLLGRLLGGAGLAVLVAALAVRSGLDPADAWTLLADPRGAVLLLRAAGCARDTAANILLDLGVGEGALPRRLDSFDSLAPDEAAAELAAWRADPAYRAAILEVGA